jgi:ketosteroid isomerase-like protein
MSGSADTVELVRQAFEAFERRDLAALRKLTDPEVEFFAPTAVLANEGRCYRGHDGLARYLRDVERMWVQLELQPLKFRAVGNHVVVLGRVQARARDGLEVETPAAWVWEVRNRRLVYGCVHSDPGRTFKGLSLPDEPAAERAAEPAPASPPSQPAAA